MVNKPRNKGTAEERRQRQLLESHGFQVRRLAEEGINDRGDLSFDVPLFGEIVVESKDRAQLQLHRTLEKAQAKAAPADVVVWWKRTEKKPGNTRRSQVGGPLVAMSEELFLVLLGEVKARNEL